MQKKELGLWLWATGYAIKGDLQEQLCEQILQEVAVGIGQSTESLQVGIWRLPVLEGQGSALTMVQPILSSLLGWLGWDTWKEHNGGYLFVVSCEPYRSENVEEVIRNHGLHITDLGRMTLTLNGFKEAHPSCP